MSEFQTLIRSRDDPLIDATIPKPELTNGLVENVRCANKIRKILLLIMYVVFLKITTFLWRILILHPGHTSLFLETITMWEEGARAEKNKYPDKKHDFFKTLILLIRVTKFSLNWIQLETDPNQTIII